MKKLKVCWECKRPSKIKKPTCCQLLYETTHPKKVIWVKK